MDLAFNIRDIERIITEVQKSPALYNKATPEYSDKNCKQKLWIEVCEAVVRNWSRMYTTARVATGKNCKNPFLFSLQFICRKSKILFIIFL
jgi:hypothetical protein